MVVNITMESGVQRVFCLLELEDNLHPVEYRNFLFSSVLGYLRVYHRNAQRRASTNFIASIIKQLEMKYAIHLVILAVVVSHFRVSSVSETNLAPTFPIHTFRLYRD